jgi:hypothetical protein
VGAINVEVKATYPGDAEARRIVRFVEKVPKVLILALGDPWPTTTLKWVACNDNRCYTGDCAWMDFRERGIGVALTERILAGDGATLRQLRTNRLMKGYTAARRARFYVDKQGDSPRPPARPATTRPPTAVRN